MTNSLGCITQFYFGEGEKVISDYHLLIVYTQIVKSYKNSDTVLKCFSTTLLQLEVVAWDTGTTGVALHKIWIHPGTQPASLGTQLVRLPSPVDQVPVLGLRTRHTVCLSWKDPSLGLFQIQACSVKAWCH